MHRAILVNYILGARHVRLGPRVIESSCSTWGRDGNSCWSSELVVSLKTTTLITVCWLRLLRLLFIHAAVVYRVVDGKESKTECGIILCALPLEIEVCERNVLLDSECTQHSCIPKSEAPVLVDLMTKSAENWWFNRLRQWFFLCPAAGLSLHCGEAELVETVIGQACSRTASHSNCLRLPREIFQMGD